MPLQPGTHLGPYEVREHIGTGGMGQVFRARDTRLERIVAVKVLSEKADARKLQFDGDAFSVAGGIEHATPSASALVSVAADGSVLSIISRRCARVARSR